MAVPEKSSGPQDKRPKKKPFTAFLKKFQFGRSSANKNASKKNRNASADNKDKENGNFIAPPPASDPDRQPTHTEPAINGHLHPIENGASLHPDDQPYQLPEPQVNGGSFASLPQNEGSLNAPASSDNKSAAPTLETNPGTTHSDTRQSKTDTAHTGGGAMSSHSGGGGNSIFSSSNHSARSLTTTLTTIQSTAPSGRLQNAMAQGANQQAHADGHHPHGHHAQSPSQGSNYAATPGSASGHHRQNPSHQPTTYRSATANNLLTDNASVLTLASSSHNHRARNSLDTDASVRAIPPASQYGNSRESLPLSTLSQNTEAQTQPTSGGGLYTAAQASRPSLGGLASAERTSVYSSQGVNAPALSSERNSVYTGRTGNQTADSGSVRGQGGDNSSIRATGDGGSVRSGHLGGGAHSRNHSITGSIGGMAASPLASPREPIGAD